MTCSRGGKVGGGRIVANKGVVSEIETEKQKSGDPL
jgi:hypothetical protein